MSYIPPLKTKKSPKEIINMHFNHFLPIKGGWGYSKEDAVIIDKNDSSIISSEIFNGVRYEYEFVEKRIYEELIVNRPPSEQYAGITWDLIEQKLITDNNQYDYLLFKVSAFLLKDWNELKEEWETNYSNPSFNRINHLQRAESKKVIFESEFWFEISSFFGKNDEIIIKNFETDKEEIIKVKNDEDFLFSPNDTKELTIEEKIMTLQPVETKYGFDLYIIDGLYYIHCKKKNFLKSVIGKGQAYGVIENQEPCDENYYKIIDYYKIYNFDNKYQLYSPSKKLISEASNIKEIYLTIQEQLRLEQIKKDERLNYQIEQERIRKEDEKGAFIGFIIFGIIFLLLITSKILTYFYHIPNGHYLAQTIKINENIIGKGTAESKKYDFILHDNNVLVDGTPYILNTKNSKSRKVYFNMFNFNEELIISSIGNVKIYNKDYNITKEIKVFY